MVVLTTATRSIDPSVSNYEGWHAHGPPRSLFIQTTTTDIGDRQAGMKKRRYSSTRVGWGGGRTS